MGVSSTIRLDIEDFFQLTPQTKFLLTFQLIILFLLSILVGIVFSPKFKARVNMRSGAPLSTVPTEVPAQNTLTLSAEKPRMQAGTKQRIDVKYTGEGAGVIDTTVLYDPKQVKVDVLKNGTLFDQVLQSSVESNRILFSAGFSLEKLSSIKPVQDATVYSFVITPIKGNKTVSLSFMQPATFIWKSRKNIITGFTNVNIAVTD